MFLFDATPPKDADRPGGHGAAFDWQILNGRRFNRPWFLAGGLDPDNVARAIELSAAPEQVDVSSGVESAPGVKSATRIADFVAAARLPHRSPSKAHEPARPIPCAPVPMRAAISALMAAALSPKP